jgi:cell pole-organizing protein PopZ
MTQAAKAQEPSMEEILASIRRIIADDDAAKAPEKTPPKAAAKPPEPAKPAPAAAPKAAAPAPAPAPRPAAPPPAPPRPAAAAPKPAPAPPPPAISAQDDIDAMFATPEPKANGAARAGDDVLELTEAMETPAEPALLRIDGTPDVVEAPPVPEPEPEPEPVETATVEQARRQFQRHTEPDRNLLSANTTAAVDSAFNSLAQTVLVQNSRTLDDLVREMLRPMLKAWLDDNLPNMVERLVRAEIERVSRGRA